MDATDLFHYEPHVDSRMLHGRTLLVTLGAFSDAGHVQSIVDDHLLNTLPSRVVGRLDMDQVHDYSGRRPEVTLELDHFTDYERPEILLHEITPEDGDPFFLLTGPEPSLQWERVASALRIVHEQLGVERTLILQGFPSPVPHTRELTVTRYAGRSDDIRVRRTMPGTFRLRAPFTALLTMRLADAGHEVVGTVVHVPQYLHEVAYPDAALALLRAVADEDGPALPLGEIEHQALTVNQSIAEQVASSEQLQQMVHAYEQQYDRLITGGVGEEVPTADDIAAEVEEFLAGLGGSDASSGEGRALSDLDRGSDEDDEEPFGPSDAPGPEQG